MSSSTFQGYRLVMIVRLSLRFYTSDWVKEKGPKASLPLLVVLPVVTSLMTDLLVGRILSQLDPRCGLFLHIDNTSATTLCETSLI